MAILSKEDHEARAAYHQEWAYAWHDQYELDRAHGVYYAEMSEHASDKAAWHAKQAMFHLFAAIDG